MSQQGESRTWDGLSIAEDEPTGSSVVVQRRVAGVTEVLLLHRAHHGADYEGDWAWTSPAGCRRPGEPVLAAAHRELAEEAGISGVELTPLDLSGRWVTFTAEVPADTEVDLVDPEHDQWRWVSPEEAVQLVRPVEVGTSQFVRLPGRPTGRVAFSELAVSDLPDVARWHGQPHVAEWFKGSPRTAEAAADHYGPRLRGESPTRMWRVDVEGRAAGYVQAYPVGAYADYAALTADPDAVGFDYVIGEPDLVGRGWGPAMLWSFLRDALCAAYPGAPRFIASPDHRNRRSLRALDLLGFSRGRWIDVPARPGEAPSTEVVCTLDRVHWFGPGDPSAS